MALLMRQFDQWAAEHVAHWVPLALLLCAPLLCAWFPGFNARQRGHDRARAVGVVAWGIVAVLGAAVASGCDVIALLLPGVAAWAAIVAWSYGEHEVRPAAAPSRGFEIGFVGPVALAAQR